MILDYADHALITKRFKSDIGRAILSRHGVHRYESNHTNYYRHVGYDAD